MIQTLWDIFLLTSIISTGVVGFLLMVLLYHLIFVAMDLRRVMRRINRVTREVEEMVLMPMEVAAKCLEWVERYLWDAYASQRNQQKGKKSKKHKGRRGKKGKNTVARGKTEGFKSKEVID